MTDIERELAAFSDGYRLGHGFGVDEGWTRGYDEAASERDLVRGLVSDMLASTKPFQAVKAAREAPIVACGSPQCRPVPRCSRCLRVANVARNRRRYGQDDFPGTVSLAVTR
jgi:hypothetical protein